MSSKRIQLLLFLGIASITLHFSIRLGGEAIRYFSLTDQAKAHITQWEIFETKNRFAIKAKFNFTDNAWPGETVLSPPYYLNEFAATSALKEKAKNAWVVWYNPKNPRAATIEKNFPTSLLVRTLICYGVIIYFSYLYKRICRV